MSAIAMLERLQRWREAGWLRRLDAAFAGFVDELDDGAPASLLLAAALLAQLEGRGHSCLPLDALTTDPVALLGWPPEAAAELAAAFTVWPADAAARRAAWQARPVLECDPVDASGLSPLVLCGERLYLRRYWRYEVRVADGIRARTDRRETMDSAAALDISSARAWLQRLFPAAAPDRTDWQQLACALALRGRLSVITGGPGTGKTYTAARLLVLLQALHTGVQPLRVALAAPTGKAAARLRQSIDVALQGLQLQLGGAQTLGPWVQRLEPARTLHGLLGARPGTRRFRHDALHPLALDLLFVDEASMVHLEMMAALFEALPPSAHLVLLGDKDQLASVEAGAVLGDLCQGAAGYDAGTAQWVRQLTGHSLPPSEQGTGSGLAQQTVMLRDSHRFAGPIGRLALAVNQGDGAAALQILHDGEEAVALIETRDPGVVASLACAGRPGAPGGYRGFAQVLGQRPAAAADFDAWAVAVLQSFDAFRVLCALREGPWGVAGINAAIERALSDAGLLACRGEWYEGRPVMVTRNDAALGVFNGDIGVVLLSPQGALRAYFLDGSALRSVSVGRLADVETAFALTVHKSQGSEFEHVLLVLPDEDLPLLTRELVYTGITRARRAFTLVARHAGLLPLAAGRLTRRMSGLRALLDSPESEARP